MNSTAGTLRNRCARVEQSRHCTRGWTSLMSAGARSLLLGTDVDRPRDARRDGDTRMVRGRARTRPAHPVQENKIQRSAPNLFRICSQGVPATRRRSRLPGRSRRPAAGPCAGAQAGPHGPDRTAWAAGRGPWRGSDGRVARFNPCAAEVADRRHAADRSCDPAGPGRAAFAAMRLPPCPSFRVIPAARESRRPPGRGWRRQSAPHGGKGTNPEEIRNVVNSHGTQPELSVNVWA